MKKTILVVDDFPSIRDYMCEILKKRGYETICANNGNDAYSVLVDNIAKISLVISDYNMPDCSGLQLLKKIKSNEKTQGIPVVFLSTDANAAKMQEAQEAGLAAWVKKPFKSATFFAQIETLMVGV